MQNLACKIYFCSFSFLKYLIYTSVAWELTSGQEFTANLAELSVDFANGWDLLYKDVKIKRTDWPRVISLAQKTSIRLVLKLT